jgi:hypothetical protein
MFSVYQKIITPESSPVLGPITAVNATTNATTNAIGPFSLCNYCCSNRNGTKNDSSGNDINEKDKKHSQEPEVSDLPECKYAFGHATHYTYSITSPRMLCEFETGTPADP